MHHRAGRKGGLAWIVVAASLLAITSVTCDDPFIDATDPDPTKSDGAACSLGATHCRNNEVMVCKDDGSGEPAWVQQTVCSSGFQTCKHTSAGAACVDLPSCTDGKKNQDETATDCGGAQCNPCGQGKACAADRDCVSKACIGKVCRPCRAGTHGCHGKLVRQCKGDHSGWTTMDTCDAAKGEACDPATKQCAPLKTLGGAKATGTYHLFAFFETGKSEYKGGYDVDGFGDRLYVNRSGKLDVYKVTLHDTDGDGKLEPNQHPEYKDNKGPMEQRKLEFLKTYSNVKLGSPSVGELFAAVDRIYFLKRDGSVDNIYEFIWGTGKTNLVVKGKLRLSCLGYDEQAKHWYGAYNSSKRYVFSYYPKGDGWAAEFLYPDLAGSHLDGIEVVTDPKNKRAYVYVSDMTSDFLAQYYRDPQSGQWVQKNVFEYKEDKNQYVEGMGFGAFQHFWITSGKALYEVGGGDLQKYVGIK